MQGMVLIVRPDHYFLKTSCQYTEFEISIMVTFTAA